MNVSAWVSTWPQAGYDVNASRLKEMRRAALLTLLVVAMAPLAAEAAIELRIDALGLGGYASDVLPTPVTVQIVSSESRAVDLTLLVQNEWGIGRRRGVTTTDRFVTQLLLQARQPVQITVPVLGTPGSSRVDAVITDASGTELARQSASSKGLNNTNPLIAIYCTAEQLCQDAQTQLTFGGSSEQSAKRNKDLRFVFLHDLRRPWWAYGAARSVVIAGSLAGASDEEKRALEGYLRYGGNLMIVEKEAADGQFLAPYRAASITAEGAVVGKGRLWSVPRLEDKSLGRAFTGILLENVINAVGNTIGLNRWTRLQTGHLLAAPFHFPRLRWLILWLLIYIFVIGPANFFLLRRLWGLEWGWVTMCAVAALFAAALYIASSSNRPKQFRLEDATICLLDEHSGMASCEFGLRVTSPVRQPVVVNIDIKDGAVLVNTYEKAPSGHETEIASDFTGKPKLQPGWEVQLGPPLMVAFPMLRWSFHDLNAVGLRDFPGSVRWLAPMRLKNDTGQSFSEAIYFDHKANKKYLLGKVAAGQEIDLASVGSEPIWTKDQDSKPHIIRGMRPEQTFSLAQLPYSGIDTRSARRIFAGLNERPGLEASLQGLQTARQSAALTLVAMGEP